MALAVWHLLIEQPHEKEVKYKFLKIIFGGLFMIGLLKNDMKYGGRESVQAPASMYGHMLYQPN